MSKKNWLVGGAVLLTTIAASDVARAQVVSFGDRPSLHLGTDLRVDVTALVQGDALDASPAPGADDGFDLARRRMGVKGAVGTHVEFEVEREIGAGAPWRDVFVNVRPVRAIQVRAGHFKMPFSLDQLTSASELDFIYRSRAADMLAPGRSTGVSLHGRLAGRMLGYDAGVFRRDGESARFGTNPGAGETVAARLTVRPLARAQRGNPLRDLELGVNATEGSVPEGRYSLRGRLASRSTFFAPVFVKGRRSRLGADVDWTPGPFGIRAELIRVEDERRDQGLIGDTVPPLGADGWYLTATWAVAGRRAMKQAENSRVPSAFKGMELAARVERLAFGSFSNLEPAWRNPRAANLAQIDEQAWTFGVNWTLNRWSRVQVNAIREQVIDSARGASAQPAASWTRVCRLQFAM